MSAIEVNSRPGRAERLAGCYGKFPYGQFREAARAVAQMRRKRRGRSRSLPLGIYRCGACNAWHIGGRGRFE